MDNRLFEECARKEKTEKSWNQLAVEYGFENGEQLRSSYRRERNRREDAGYIQDVSEESSSYEEADGFINIICASKRILTKEDIIKQFNIDMSVWEIEKFKVKTSEGYRKDRKIIWKVEEGHVIKGDVNDSGKMLVVPLYHIEVRLIKRIAPSIEDISKDFENFQTTYKVPIFKYTDLNLRDNMLEVSITDLHLGKLAWGKESGEDYDSKIARQRFIFAINDIISRTNNQKFEKIIFPVGHDFFNADTVSGATTKGTPLQNDSRWQKMFYTGVHLLVEGVDILSTVAPVEIYWIPGNHDTMSSYYAVNYLAAWYRDSESVKVDLSPTPRKYVEYGQCLLGFAHGTTDSKRIHQLMQVEAREAWGRTIFHEFHLGNLHHDAVTEHGGLIVRRLSSLTSADDWLVSMGFIGAVQKAQAFVWNKERGLLQIINSPV